MKKNHKEKRIVIIGGMGPQASIHAHRRLQELLIKNGKSAEIVHVSLVVEHFFRSKPTLNLNSRQINLLKSIDADMGFIACNTAHLFFDQISNLVNFKLFSMLDFNRDTNHTMVCSPTSKKFRVFGDNVKYLTKKLDNISGEIIESVNMGKGRLATEGFKNLIDLVPKGQNCLISCTELSMLAYQLGFDAKCTLEETLKKIIKNI